MDELIFSAMDVPDEVEKTLNKVMHKICCEMNDSEKRAFDYGVNTTLAILRSLLELDEEPAVHVSGLNELQEMTLEELEGIFLD
jgi:hypothetical protein